MNCNTKKNIMLVDDHTLFRNGLKMLINKSEDFTVCTEASNGIEFLEKLEKAPLPDIVLLDISMPEMDGIEAATLALKRYPQLQIVTLSMYGEEDYYFKMMSIGVKGFLLKNSEISEVLEALKAVCNGGNHFSTELLTNLRISLRETKHLNNYNILSEISEREKEILVLICKGMSNIEIADKLFISKRTVDKHRANILAKTSCKNTANLVVYAIKNHIVEI
ncbi:MAG: response regulator transcription factor [Rikenellaceae bacterium]